MVFARGGQGLADVDQRVPGQQGFSPEEGHLGLQFGIAPQPGQQDLHGPVGDGLAHDHPLSALIGSAEHVAVGATQVAAVREHHVEGQGAFSGACSLGGLAVEQQVAVGCEEGLGVGVVVFPGQEQQPEVLAAEQGLVPGVASEGDEVVVGDGGHWGWGEEGGRGIVGDWGWVGRLAAVAPGPNAWRRHGAMLPNRGDAMLAEDPWSLQGSP